MPKKHALADYLKKVVVRQAKRQSDLLGSRQDIRHVLVREFVKFLGMVCP